MFLAVGVDLGGLWMILNVYAVLFFLTAFVSFRWLLTVFDSWGQVGPFPGLQFLNVFVCLFLTIVGGV